MTSGCSWQIIDVYLQAWTRSSPRTVPCRTPDVTSAWGKCMPSSSTDPARNCSNQCDIYRVVKVVHGNWSDNHCKCNQPDRLPSIVYYYQYYYQYYCTRALLVANTLFSPLSRIHARTCSLCRIFFKFKYIYIHILFLNWGVGVWGAVKNKSWQI